MFNLLTIPTFKQGQALRKDPEKLCKKITQQPTLGMYDKNFAELKATVRQ